MATDGKWYPPHLHPDAQSWAPAETAGHPYGRPEDAPPGYGQSHPAGQPASSGPAVWGQPAPGTAPAYGPAPAYGATAPYGPTAPWGPPPAFGAPPGYGQVPPYGAPPGYAFPPAWGAPPRLYVDEVLRVPLAPWWKRLVAILIDGMIVGLSTLVVVLVFAAALGPSTTTNQPQQSSAGATLGALAGLWIVLAIPGAVYFGALNGSRRGQTVGKMALGIAVRDAQTGAPIGFWRAVGRNLITVVFSIALYIPYILDSLAPLWDRRRQAWHDKVAHSVVVDVRP